MTSDLLNMPLVSVYAFVNDSDKKIYLTYSHETIVALARNVKAIADSSHSCRQLVLDRNKIEFKIIETVKDRNSLKVRYEFYVDYYRNLGYSMYRNYSSVSYKVRVSITDLDTVSVFLVNRRNDKTLVGRFHTVEEATQWSNSVYPQGMKIYEIKYHESMIVSKN